MAADTPDETPDDTVVSESPASAAEPGTSPAGGTAGAGTDGADTELSDEAFDEDFNAAFHDEAESFAEALDSAPSEFDVVSAERDQFKDIAQRLQADFDNYRKRMVSQQDSEIDRATGKFAEALLPVLDACEAAFAHGAEGVEPIWSALLGTLQKLGLEALDLAGKPFDPTHADAVVHEPADDSDAETVVSEVLRTGYLWRGKTLRPAMVKVRG